MPVPWKKVKSTRISRLVNDQLNISVDGDDVDEGGGGEGDGDVNGVLIGCKKLEEKQEPSTKPVSFPPNATVSRSSIQETQPLEDYLSKTRR